MRTPANLADLSSGSLHAAMRQPGGPVCVCRGAWAGEGLLLALSALRAVRRLLPVLGVRGLAELMALRWDAEETTSEEEGEDSLAASRPSATLTLQGRAPECAVQCDWQEACTALHMGHARLGAILPLFSARAC